MITLLNVYFKGKTVNEIKADKSSKKVYLKLNDVMADSIIDKSELKEIEELIKNEKGKKN